MCVADNTKTILSKGVQRYAKTICPLSLKPRSQHKPFDEFRHRHTEIIRSNWNKELFALPSLQALPSQLTEAHHHKNTKEERIGQTERERIKKKGGGADHTGIIPMDVKSAHLLTNGGPESSTM